jgi:predicted ribosomally synthesized peptide with SipW-like signal peptide
VKKILLSIMIIALVCALVGTGVFAALNDSETSVGNQFATGTLDLEVDDENPWTSVKLDADSMEPGDSGAVTCKLENVGTLPGSFLTVDITNLVDSAGATPEPEPTPDNGELSANMDIVLWEDNGAGAGGVAGDGIQNGTEVTLYSGKLNATAGPYTVGSGLIAGATTYVGISYSIAGSVGSEIQDDSCTFDIEFILNQ